MPDAFYNEFDAKAAEWLRELCKERAIAPGVVDERSVVEVAPEDVNKHEQCHFFAGIGGWSYATELAGWGGPIWTASLPCQPFSQAGKQRGVDDERHLWPVFRDLVTQCLPPVIVGEQVASKAGRAWLATVQADLEALGYATAAADLCAAGVGAPHIRQRIYWGAVRVADTSCERRNRQHALLWEGLGNRRPADLLKTSWSRCDYLPCRDGKARPVEPGLEPLAHGIPGRVGLLRGYGNAIVPQVAATFLMSFREALANA